MKSLDVAILAGFSAALAAAYFSGTNRIWFVMAAAAFAALLALMGVVRWIRLERWLSAHRLRAFRERVLQTSTPSVPPNSEQARSTGARALESSANHERRTREFRRRARATTLLGALLDGSAPDHSPIEFKRRICRADGSGRLSKRILREICATLSAMANQAQDAPGYVVVGVGRGPAWPELDGRASVLPIRYGSLWVGGINQEVRARGTDAGGWLEAVNRRLEQDARLDPDLRAQVIRDSQLVEFLGRTVLVLTARPLNRPCRYGSCQFRRERGSTVEVHAARNKSGKPDSGRISADRHGRARADAGARSVVGLRPS